MSFSTLFLGNEPKDGETRTQLNQSVLIGGMKNYQQTNLLQKVFPVGWHKQKILDIQNGQNLFATFQIHTKYRVSEILRISLLYLKEQLIKFNTSQCERHL
jgi:hypothetical protein